MSQPLTDFSRLCVHTITTKPWTVEEATAKYAAADVSGVTVWRAWLEGRDIKQVGKNFRDAGIDVVSLCRGGFFPSIDPEKRKLAIEDNLLAVEEAEKLGAPMIVLVCGAEPQQPLATSREQILDGIAAVLPRCRDAGIKLAIEPLHPMYADTRSAVNTLAQASEMVEELADPLVGIAVDVYHLWWDDFLEAEIIRAGKNGSIFAFHVCDWRVPTRDFLNDRGLMGEGCIDVPLIRSWVEQAGFDGFIEVEIFSDEYWAMDQDRFLEKIKKAYLEAV